MKTRTIALLCVLLIIAQVVLADGLFPTANELFGEWVTSVVAIMARKADVDTKSENAHTLVFENFTLNEYEKLSAGLAAEKCTLVQSHPGAASAVAVVTSGNYNITLNYEFPSSRLTATYPAGVRLKNSSVEQESGMQGILPQAGLFVGESVPSVAAVIHMATDLSADQYGAMVEKADYVSESDYEKYGQALGGENWTLGSVQTSNGAVSATLTKGNAVIKTVYSPTTRSMTVQYSSLTCVTNDTPAIGASVLPSLDSALGVSMPTLAEALLRLPDKEYTDNEGRIIQNYADFTDDDYNKFSAYLQTENCAVNGYSLEGMIMTIELAQNNHNFTFKYDREKHSASMVYAVGTRPGQAMLAMAAPTATPKVTPIVTAIPTPSEAPIKKGGVPTKGQYVTFGTYDQDNNTGNGREPIQWKVLDVQGNKALLISEYVLDTHSYHSNTNGVLWNQSSLRDWLNGTFYNGAFSTQEKNAIVPFVLKSQGTTYTAKVEIDDKSGASIWKDVKRSERLIKLVTGKMVTVTGSEVKNDNYKYVPVTYTENGKTYTGYMESRFLKLVKYETVEVNDKVTILSQSEVQKYLEKPARAKPTGTAYANGINGGQNGCYWWTRDDNNSEMQAPLINAAGITSSTKPADTKVGVRPALWVDASKISLTITSGVQATNTPSPTKVPTPSPVPTLFKAKVGETVKFGSYEQDNKTSNGKEPIEWIVLKVDGTKALLVSKTALESKAFQEDVDKAYQSGVNWKSCTLRTWLNGSFINTAFTKAEQKQLVQTTITTKDATGTFTTNDRVFLLSTTEAHQYIGIGQKMRCKSNAYTDGEGLISNDDGYCWWWLRDMYTKYEEPGIRSFTGSSNRVYLSSSNNLREYKDMGFAPYGDYIGVRPAIWIDTVVR